MTSLSISSSRSKRQGTVNTNFIYCTLRMCVRVFCFRGPSVSACVNKNGAEHLDFSMVEPKHQEIVFPGSRLTCQGTVNTNFIYCTLRVCAGRRFVFPGTIGLCRMHTLGAEHLDFSMVKVKASRHCLSTLSNKTSTCCPDMFKVKISRYSKYELYLLYLSDVREDILFSGPSVFVVCTH